MDVSTFNLFILSISQILLEFNRYLDLIQIWRRKKLIILVDIMWIPIGIKSEYYMAVQVMWYQFLLVIILTIHWSSYFRAQQSTHIDIIDNGEYVISLHNLKTGTLTDQVITQQLMDLDGLHGSKYVIGWSDERNGFVYLNSAYLFCSYLYRNRFGYRY